MCVVDVCLGICLMMVYLIYVMEVPDGGGGGMLDGRGYWFYCVQDILISPDKNYDSSLLCRLSVKLHQIQLNPSPRDTLIRSVDAFLKWGAIFPM